MTLSLSLPGARTEPSAFLTKTCVRDPLAVRERKDGGRGFGSSRRPFLQTMSGFGYTALILNKQSLLRGGRQSLLRGRGGYVELSLGHLGSQKQAQRKVVWQRFSATLSGF